MRIDTSAVNSLRGYEFQNYIALLGLIHILILKNKTLNTLIVEGTDDVQLDGENFGILIQVKKNERVGQWKPSEITEIAKKLFIRWENSLFRFDTSECGDKFVVALEGDISPNLFNADENIDDCLINFQDLFTIPRNTTLKSTSKLKERIEDGLDRDDITIEPSKLNYFIRNFRICHHIPNLDDLIRVVYERCRELLENITDNTDIQAINEFFNNCLEKIKKSSRSKDEEDHILLYDEIFEIFERFLIQDLENYIRRLDRYKDRQISRNVLTRKIENAGGSQDKIDSAISSKISYLRSIRNSNLDIQAYENLYYEYISWMRSKNTDHEFQELDELNEQFIENNQYLFKELDDLRYPNKLRGIFFDLTSYCTFNLNGINYVQK